MQQDQGLLSWRRPPQALTRTRLMLLDCAVAARVTGWRASSAALCLLSACCRSPRRRRWPRRSTPDGDMPASPAGVQNLLRLPEQTTYYGVSAAAPVTAGQPEVRQPGPRLRATQLGGLARGARSVSSSPAARGAVSSHTPRRQERVPSRFVSTDDTRPNSGPNTGKAGPAKCDTVRGPSVSTGDMTPTR